jgi:hypothetical protein
MTQGATYFENGNGVFYNPEKDLLGIGVHYFKPDNSNTKYCILIDIKKNGNMKVFVLNDDWLEGWEYLGALG